MTCVALDGPLPLFELAREVQLAALAASPLGALRPGEKVADLFCGACGPGVGPSERRAQGQDYDGAQVCDVYWIETGAPR